MVTAGELLELPPTLAVEEAGELLGLSRSAAYRAVARGDLPTIRIGRRYRVPGHTLLHMLGADLGRSHRPRGLATSPGGRAHEAG